MLTRTSGANLSSLEGHLRTTRGPNRSKEEEGVRAPARDGPDEQ